MGNFQMAGETKINGMGLLHDIRQQWGLLGTRQKKLNANEMNRKKVMAFLKKCTCTYFKVRRGTNGLTESTRCHCALAQSKENAL